MEYRSPEMIERGGAKPRPSVIVVDISLENKAKGLGRNWSSLWSAASSNGSLQGSFFLAFAFMLGKLIHTTCDERRHDGRK